MQTSLPEKLTFGTEYTSGSSLLDAKQTINQLIDYLKEREKVQQSVITTDKLPSDFKMEPGCIVPMKPKRDYDVDISITIDAHGFNHIDIGPFTNNAYTLAYRERLLEMGKN